METPQYFLDRISFYYKSLKECINKRSNLQGINISQKNLLDQTLSCVEKLLLKFGELGIKSNEPIRSIIYRLYKITKKLHTLSRFDASNARKLSKHCIILKAQCKNVIKTFGDGNAKYSAMYEEIQKYFKHKSIISIDDFISKLYKHEYSQILISCPESKIFHSLQSIKRLLDFTEDGTMSVWKWAQIRRWIQSISPVFELLNTSQYNLGFVSDEEAEYLLKENGAPFSYCIKFSPKLPEIIIKKQDEIKKYTIQYGYNTISVDNPAISIINNNSLSSFIRTFIGYMELENRHNFVPLSCAKYYSEMNIGYLRMLSKKDLTKINMRLEEILRAPLNPDLSSIHETNTNASANTNPNNGYSKICCVCLETGKELFIPFGPNGSCKHDPNICMECFNQTIKYSDKCPLCMSKMTGVRKQ
jgi:hypothetical protein